MKQHVDDGSICLGEPIRLGFETSVLDLAVNMEPATRSALFHSLEGFSKLLSHELRVPTGKGRPPLRLACATEQASSLALETQHLLKHRC